MTQRNPGRQMRVVLLLLLALQASACTGLLLGGGSNPGPPLGSDTRSTSAVATDNAITSTVRQRLVADSLVGKYELRVQTINRRVSLYGTVGSYAARDQAGRLAQSVGGVDSLDNQIRVDTRADRY